MVQKYGAASRALGLSSTLALVGRDGGQAVPDAESDVQRLAGLPRVDQKGKMSLEVVGSDGGGPRGAPQVVVDDQSLARAAHRHLEHTDCIRRALVVEDQLAAARREGSAEEIVRHDGEGADGHHADRSRGHHALGEAGERGDAQETGQRKIEPHEELQAALHPEQRDENERDAQGAEDGAHGVGGVHAANQLTRILPFSSDPCEGDRKAGTPEEGRRESHDQAAEQVELE